MCVKGDFIAVSAITYSSLFPTKAHFISSCGWEIVWAGFHSDAAHADESAYNIYEDAIDMGGRQLREAGPYADESACTAFCLVTDAIKTNTTSTCSLLYVSFDILTTHRLCAETRWRTSMLPPTVAVTLYIL